MALNIENIVAELKEATILELNDLVKAIEEEFGVTAAAPVAVAAAGGAEGGTAKDSFDVILKDAGASKINVIKVVVASCLIMLVDVYQVLQTVLDKLLVRALKLQALV